MHLACGNEIREKSLEVSVRQYCTFSSRL